MISIQRHWLYLSLFVLCALNSYGQENEASFEVGQGGAQRGEQVIIPVIIENKNNTSAVQFAINYPANVLALVKPTKGSGILNHQLKTYKNSGGKSSFVIFSNRNRMVDGVELVLIPFQINPSSVPGEYPVQLTDVIASDPNSIRIPSIVKNGLIQVESDRPISVGSIFFSPDGQFEITLENARGKAYVIESSRNLRDWEVVFQGIAEDNVVIFKDDSTGNNDVRFYRIIQVPQ